MTRKLGIRGAVLPLLGALAFGTPAALADELSVDDAAAGAADELAADAVADEAVADEAVVDSPAAVGVVGPDEVRWTVDAEGTLESVAERWGVRTSTLVALNPELDRDAALAPGTSLVVYRRDPDKPTFSVGRPNDGKLRNGIPLPEGPNWVSKSHRFQYGSEVAVSTLLEVFAKYGEAYPDGQKLRVGDLSRKGGGKIGRKHESHRSGRDADLGYIGLEENEVNGWVVVTPETLDLEKTWFLVDTLLATGRVQVMFMDKELQRALNAYVKERYPDRFTKEELAMLFEYPRRVHSHRAVIQHWDHHADHLHVRFVCEAGNWRCQGRGKWGE